MTPFLLTVLVLKFFIPGFFSVLFQAFGLGYRSKKSLAAGLLVYSVYTSGLTAALILLMGYGEFTHIAPLVMAAGGLSVLIFSTDRAGIAIFLQLTQGCMSTVISVILNAIRTVFSISYPVLVLMICVVYPLVYLFALRHWAKPMRFMADNIRTLLPALVALPILLTGIVSFLPTYPAQSFSRHPVYITAMMLAVEAVYFLFLYSFYRNLLEIGSLLKDEARTKLLEREILSYQESLENTRQARHDLRHHNALVLDFLENDNVAGAVDYLRQSSSALAAARTLQYSANPTANAVLRIYSRQAQANEIAFAAHADLPESLPLTAPELGALLSNLLENAVEACKRTEPPQRSIAFRAESDDAAVRLEVRNSVFGTVAFENEMPVSDRPGGGTGTKSIARIVHSHGGMLRFQQDGDAFFVQIILPLSH